MPPIKVIDTSYRKLYTLATRLVHPSVSVLAPTIFATEETSMSIKGGEPKKKSTKKKAAPKKAAKKNAAKKR